MTREQKLALIVGFALVLIVGVLVSDHLSLAQERVAGDEAGLAEALEPEEPGLGRAWSGLAVADPAGRRAESRADIEPPVLDEAYFSGPEDDAEGGRTLEDRARNALGTLADGAERAVALLRESQNGNLPAAQTDRIETFEMPSLREADERRATPPPVRTADRGATDARASYLRHVVKEGESLWSIAVEHYGDGTLHTRLAELNADRTGPNGTVYAGATILVPPLEVLGGKSASRATRSEVKSMPRRGSDASSGVTRSGSGVREYVVQAGDTLSEISQRMLGTSKRWREILELNGMEDPSSLRVGMTIEIPSG